MSAAQNLEAFLATYVDTNRAPGSPPFDRSFLFDDVLARLQNTGYRKLALPIMTAQCCALKRADIVPAMFLSLHGGRSDSEQIVLEDFVALRETITIIWPFVGIPNVIPIALQKACLGLSKCLEARGLNPPKSYRLENNFALSDPVLGIKTRREIYKASANSEVFDMLDQNFGDLAYVLNTVGFGFNIGHTNPLAFSLNEAELILTAALIALGATRQAGSHVKACIGFGYSESDVEAIVDTANMLAQWQSRDARFKVLPVNVEELARQARLNLGIPAAKN